MEIKTKMLPVFFVCFLICFLAVDSLAQRKSRSRGSGRPSAQSRQDQSVTTSYNEATGETEIKLKFLLAAASRSQAFYIGAAFSDSSPDSAVLAIMSISTRYHYESYSYVQILADGSRLSYRDKYDSYRQAGVDNGNAVETLSVILTFDEFRGLAAASRVDITAWIDRFALNPSNIYAIRDFVRKVEAASERAKQKSQARVDVPAPRPEPTPTATPTPEPKCDLTIAQSPEIRGFRLGMTADQVLPRFYNRYGSPLRPTGERQQISFSKYQRNLPDTPEYEGINVIYFTFIENRVTSIEVVYNNYGLNLWNDTDSFIAVLLKSLILPRSWRRNYGYEQGYEASCDGWTLSVFGNNSLGKIKWVDVGTEAAYVRREEEKRRAEEERRRSTFKP